MAVIRYLVNEVDVAIEFYINILGFLEQIGARDQGPRIVGGQSGAQLRSEIVSGPGGKQILVNDPSGNPVELFESSAE